MKTEEAPEPGDLLAQIGASVRDLGQRVETAVDRWTGATSPTAFRAMELEVAEMARAFADTVAGWVLHAIVADVAFQGATSAAARADPERKLRHGGRRSSEVRLLGGGSTRVEVEYLKANRRKQRGPRRSGRGLGGSGMYPALSALGIEDGVTPALASEICRQVADSDSVRAGRSALARRGLDLGHKQTLRIVNNFGGRAVQLRDAWIAEVGEREEPVPSVVQGKRVVIATDGGRLRERVARRGRRHARTRHHRYDAPWREPKLVTIYVIDKKGRVEQSFRPIYDGTLEDCDALFAMLAAYLKAIGVYAASDLLVLGDGAKWIWERIEQLGVAVGIPRTRVTEVVDWYHAVEKLGEVAAILPAAQGERWLRGAKDALYRGDMKALKQCFDSVAVGRRARAVNGHLDYFTRNAHRMQYKAFKKRNVPLGSGAVESAVRRVVNMRLKGCGTFWKYDSAQAMLILRCYLKAERFDDLVDWSITRTVAWWRPEQGRRAPIEVAA